ncbi:SDR family NAD(P)-dependent oxidoreductase [Nocardioides bizhenqiangii]|uniref:SDR family oxidoreductase n=1 Tax=Nocardioides bizhenqiangii TaxID=3095076 RepID=A0ABZ0ZPX4_9ACTN|nr:SDR family oxidoreductase [Nocardioides sp. HM61]WQQ26338.1 SDR family oxidoreductase [Nocardioides sp. HM61]
MTSTNDADRARRFTDKRVLVTGAAGGLGAEVARLFRVEGARVVGVDVVPSEGVAVGDLTDPEAIRQMADATLTELGGLDVLCNVAGVLAMSKLEDITPELLNRHLAVNATGPILLTQALAPALAESKGNVVTVASISAVMGQPYNTMYCASKGAVLLAMRALAVELAGRGIRVNCVSPGGIDTPMAAGAAHSMPADVDWSLIAKSQGVMPGFMPPADVAEAILFLASAGAASVTGANLVVDRGVVW